MRGIGSGWQRTEQARGGNRCGASCGSAALLGTRVNRCSHALSYLRPVWKEHPERSLRHVSRMMHVASSLINATTPNTYLVATVPLTRTHRIAKPRQLVS